MKTKFHERKNFKIKILSKTLFYFFMLTAIIACKKQDELNKNKGTTSPARTLIKSFDSLSANTLDHLTDISFIDDDHGIICGGYGFLAKTDDGGQTWTSINVGATETFTSAYMLDAQNMFVSRSAMYKTNNAGTTFNEVSMPAGSTIWDIHYYNADTGLVMKMGSLLKTTNGVDWNIKFDESGIVSKMQVMPNTVYIAGGYVAIDAASQPATGLIYKSIDRGDSWTKILQTNGYLSSIYFLDDNVGFYGTYGQDIYKTTNGGQTWTKLAHMLYAPQTICFIDESTGYIGTLNGEIVKTSDGGASWQVVHEEIGSINKIIKTSGWIYAIGNNGVMLRKRI